MGYGKLPGLYSSIALIHAPCLLRGRGPGPLPLFFTIEKHLVKYHRHAGEVLTRWTSGAGVAVKLKGLMPGLGETPSEPVRQLELPG